MRQSEIYERLTEIFHEVFGDDKIVLSAQTSAKDIDGWDSVRMIGIILAVERAFAIKVRSREADRLQCVGDFVDLIASKSS